MNFNFNLNTYKKRDKTQAIRLKIDTSAKDIQYLDADVSILSSQWDNKKKKVKRHPLEDQINAKLNAFKLDVQRVYYKNDGISAKRLHFIYKNLKKFDSGSLICFYQQIVDDKRRRKKIRTAITSQRYIDKLKKYSKTIFFSDLSVQWAMDYEKWMLERGNKINTVASNFRSLYAVLNKAVKAGVIEKNPIKGFKIVAENVEKESLTLEEIKRLEEIEIHPRFKGMVKARDVFLFSFYTAGMRFSDMCRLKWSNIIGNDIVYTMQKSKDRSGSRRVLALNPKSKAILEKYKGRDDHFVFPMLYGYHKKDIDKIEYRIYIQNNNLNRALKIVAKKCGINKSVSMHMAKHSFTDYAVKQKVGIRMISELLGHTKLSTTENYLKDFYQEEQHNTMNKLFG